MVCVCDRRKNFAIETHKSVVSVFSSVGVCGKGTLELVCVWVSVYFKIVSKVDSVKRNGSKYTIYTCFLLLFLVETFRNRWLSAQI